MLTRVKLLMRNVQKPRKPRMTKPDNMHLISEMPEPAAYLARERTRWEATKEKVALGCVVSGQLVVELGLHRRTAKSTYMNQRATVTVLHKCQASHAPSSSISSSQQQNSWFNHQPSEQ